MDDVQAMVEAVRARVAARSAGNDLGETRDALLDRARQRFGRIDPTRVVDHVLRVTEDADFAVRKAALDALARRFSRSWPRLPVPRAWAASPSAGVPIAGRALARLPRATRPPCWRSSP